MMGRRLYKTKLCMLYQRGRCSRQSCNFAHGEAELRRFGGSSNGRRENRNADLRDRLDRRHSPYHRFSPARDRRGHHSFHNERPVSHERAGSSLSRSPVRRSEKRYRRKQQVDGDSDVSEGFRVSDGPIDRKKDNKASTNNEKHGLEEQLKQIRLDNEILEDHKSQLESYLEEKVNEAEKLTDHIEDLEAQLKMDQDECKRLNSRISKFIKLLNKQIKLQEELKRVEARLQKETDQFSSDILKSGANAEDSSANVLESNELNVDNPSNYRSHELQNSISTKKRLLDHISLVEEAKKGESRKKQRSSEAMFKLEKLIGSGGPAQHSVKGAIPVRSKITEDDHRQKHAKNATAIVNSLDKGKGSEVRHSLPSTGLAAHAGDELAIEAIESEERLDTIEPAIIFENGDKGNGVKSSYMPPPPPPLLSAKNTYKQYEGDDEEVDVEKVDDDMLDIDLNSEVEIEQV